MRRQTKGRKERILSHSAGLPALLHCHLNGERITGSEASNLLLLRSPDPTLHFQTLETWEAAILFKPKGVGRTGFRMTQHKIFFKLEN